MPSLSSAIWCSIGSAIAFIMASDYAPKFPIWFKFILVAIGLILAAGAISQGINWLAFVTAQRTAEVRRLATITPMMEAVRLMSRLSPLAQVELAMHFDSLGVDYQAWVSTSRGPSFYYRAGGHNIPYEFIHQFFLLATDRYLPAVRQWSDGSNEHKWADALTADLIKRHLAILASGPHPAAWKFERDGKTSMRYRATQAFFEAEESDNS